MGYFCTLGRVAMRPAESATDSHSIRISSVCVALQDGHSRNTLAYCFRIRGTSLGDQSPSVPPCVPIVNSLHEAIENRRVLIVASASRTGRPTASLANDSMNREAVILAGIARFWCLLLVLRLRCSGLPNFPMHVSIAKVLSAFRAII